MPRGKKIRSIDYNLKEMMELCEISTRPTFNKRISKFCELYGFKKEDFKIDNAKRGDYYFPADFAELLALLLKTQNQYPLNRANAVSENIKATQIKEYNQIICEGIDNELNDIFYKLIYTMPCHLQALEIVDLTSVLIERLTLFIVNITKLDHQEIGETLKWLCNALDEANYNLFRGSYVKNKEIESNIAYTDEHYKELQNAIYGMKNDEIDTIEKELSMSNNSIDYAIALLIKRFMHDTKDLNSGDKGTEYLTIKDNAMLKVLGLKLAVTEDENKDVYDSNFIERDLYYRSLLGKYVSPAKYEIAESVIKNYNDRIKKRKSFLDKIKDGSFREPSELNIDEKKQILEANIRDMQEELARLQEESLVKDIMVNDFLNVMRKEYVEHCENTKFDSKKLNNAVDAFVGQVLLNTLNTNGNV